MEPQHSIQFLRTRKFLLILPLMVLPFLSLAFYAVGGGQGSIAAGPAEQNRGLNTSLPAAAFGKQEKPKDKMGFYDQAKLDSAKEQSYSNNPLLQEMGIKKDRAAIPDISSSGFPANQPDVHLINQKLAAIDREISRPAVPPVPAATQNQPVENKQLTEQVNRLETMMRSMKADSGPDPEMQQLSKMLEQIQAIQRSETPKADHQADSAATNPFKAIPAVIDGNQKIKQSGAVRLCLNDTVTIKGQLIPKGTPVYGTANMINQRLLIIIKNIRLGQSIIPADLTVYYMDGMPGVPAPEAELGEAAGNGAGNALQGMQFLSMDQSLATQAAAGGINAAKGLFNKKVRRITVHLKNGDAVLLRNNQIR